MAVAAADAAVEVVDPQLRPLAAADLSSLVDGLAFDVVMATGTLAAAPLDVPASPGL